MSEYYTLYFVKQLVLDFIPNDFDNILNRSSLEIDFGRKALVNVSKLKFDFGLESEFVDLKLATNRDAKLKVAEDGINQLGQTSGALFRRLVKRTKKIRPSNKSRMENN